MGRCAIVLPLRWLLAACAAASGADGCGFGSFDKLKGIEAVCCESAPSPDCSKGFPTVCTLACAKLIVPFEADCGTMMAKMESSGTSNL